MNLRLSTSRRTCPERGQHDFCCVLDWSFENTPRRIFMATAAHVFADGCDVDLAFAAQAQADASVGEFAQKNCRFDTSNGQGVVRHAFAILFRRTTSKHVMVRDGKPCE